MGERLRALARNPWVRVSVVAVLLAALLWVLSRRTDLIEEGWRNVSGADARWVGAAAAVLAGGMVAQAEMMVVLLRGAGVRVRRWSANLLGLAANAWSASLPGGPAVSAAMIFREQLAWGASTVVASWYLVISGLLASAGMAVLGLGAVFFLDAEINPLTLLASLALLGAVAWAFHWLARHPSTVARWAGAALRVLNRATGADPRRGLDRLDKLAGQLSAVDVPLHVVLRAGGWSVVNWCCEIACLWAGLQAVGARPTVAGAVLAFLLAKLVGQAQITPGGLGPVDVAMVSLLVPLAQIPSAAAVAGVFVYRGLSFLGLAAVGWIVFFVGWLARRR